MAAVTGGCGSPLPHDHRPQLHPGVALGRTALQLDDVVQHILAQEFDHISVSLALPLLQHGVERLETAFYYVDDCLTRRVACRARPVHAWRLRARRIEPTFPGFDAQF